MRLDCHLSGTSGRNRQGVYMRFTWAVTPIFAEKWIAKRKRHFDELADDSRLSNPENCFSVSIFSIRCSALPLIRLLSVLRPMLTITEKFSVLNPADLSRLDEHVILEAAGRLRNTRSFGSRFLCSYSFLLESVTDRLYRPIQPSSC